MGDSSAAVAACRVLTPSVRFVSRCGRLDPREPGRQLQATAPQRHG